MNDYQFILEPYQSSKNRFVCPNCGKRNQFTKYVNTVTGEYIDNKVGKCNRVQKCGYHLTPKSFFDSSIGSNRYENHRFKSPKPIAPTLNRYEDQKAITFLEPKILKESFHRHGENNFMKYLISLFGADIAEGLKQEYLIGTYERDLSRVDFFQFDINGKVRQVKNLGYNAQTGKKINVFFSYPKSKYPDYNLVQCFFGEHLLKKYPDKKVAICESEKSAIIASAYIKEFVWLASGNVNGLNFEKSKVLKGRTVILYPDLGQYEYWKSKIDKLEPKANYKVSKLLEEVATDSEKSEGLDIADYLVKKTLKQFRPKGRDNKPKEKYDPDFKKEEFEENKDIPKGFLYEYGDEIKELETFFKTFDLTVLAPVKLNKSEVIKDPSKFCESHLNVLRSAKNNRGAAPYLNRLKAFRKAIDSDVKLTKVTWF